MDSIKFTGRSRSNVRKREVVHILDSSHWLAFDCHVEERCSVEGRVPIPIHGKYGGVSTKPVAA